MLRFARLYTLFLALLTLGACALPGQPGKIYVLDDSEALDTERINKAAMPLLEQRANLAIILVDKGTNDALPALQTLGMVRNGSIVDRGVAIYISMQPRYSELRVGQPWNESLSSDTLRQLRLNVLNPALQAADPNAGVEATLVALSAGIAAYEANNARLWQLGLAAVGVFSAFIMLRILSPRLAATPFGQALEQLWERTPIGVHQARKRLKQQVEQSRLRLDLSRQRAHHEQAQLPGLTAGFSTQLAALEARYEALHKRDADTDMLHELDQLGLAYEEWLNQFRAMRKDMRSLEQAITFTQSILHRLERTFQNRIVASGKAKRKAGAAITEQHKAQLAELGMRYTILEQEWKAYKPEDMSTAALHSRRELLTGLKNLDQHIYALWQLALPLEFANYQRQAYSSDVSTSSSSDSSSWSSSSDSSTSSSSDSSSWSSSSDSSASSSSSDSSDGGSW